MFVHICYSWLEVPLQILSVLYSDKIWSFKYRCLLLHPVLFTGSFVIWMLCNFVMVAFPYVRVNRSSTPGQLKTISSQIKRTSCCDARRCYQASWTVTLYVRISYSVWRKLMAGDFILSSFGRCQQQSSLSNECNTSALSLYQHALIHSHAFFHTWIDCEQLSHHIHNFTVSFFGNQCSIGAWQRGDRKRCSVIVNKTNNNFKKELKKKNFVQVA